MMILMALTETQLTTIGNRYALFHSRIADLVIRITGELIECLKLDSCKLSVRPFNLNDCGVYHLRSFDGIGVPEFLCE